MARSMAVAALSQEDVSRFSTRKPGDFEDSWPDEPTAVDAALTMEELIVDELRRQGQLPPPANGVTRTTGKGTSLR
ncbi:MAG TPA: hypothetical protein VN914_00525 [Polyangia bacterium]|nr:hypothetical protein [Polyangia bacterium]